MIQSERGLDDENNGEEGRKMERGNEDSMEGNDHLDHDVCPFSSILLIYIAT